jgi:CRP-like cAMP-binding protein
MDLQGLQQFPFLQDFSDIELRELFATAGEEHLSAGTFVCREGEPGGALYFVVSGQVEISKKGKDGEVRVITQLGDGTLLGELSWITGASLQCECPSETGDCGSSSRRRGVNAAIPSALCRSAQV